MGGDLANPEVGEPETQGMVVGDDPSCGLFGEYGDAGNFNQAGEVFGFLGPNGAGKSTMMKILTTYLKASSGTTSVNNFSTQDEALAVRRSVGYLAENNPLYPEMYIREYLKLHADLNKAPKERIETVIELTGLQPEISKKIKQLSKGYKQRVGLAAALIHDPEVLILDEPTAGINPTLINGIIDRLIKVNKEFGITLLVIEHNMRVIMNLAQKIFCLAHGELLAEGLPEQIKNDKRVVDAYLGAK